MNFEKKVAFITGSAQGIGKATALVLAKYGADIVAADLNEEGAKKTIEQVKALNRDGMAIKLDVTNEKDVNDAIDKAIEKFGKIDILVNAAGIAIQSMVLNTSVEMWNKTFDINIKGVFLCCKAAVKHMLKNNSGKIVNLSSRAAKIGESTNAAYCCSKAAVSMFTQVLALEMATSNINVNAVCPGMINTEMIQNAIVRFSKEKGLPADEFAKNWIGEIPMKRMGEPEEVGEFIAFLCSDKANYLTGSAFNIDGGAVRI